MPADTRLPDDTSTPERPLAPHPKPRKRAPKPPTERVDGQITGLAGELFVAAELLKRGLQTSVTFGNAKSIDLLAYNPKTEQSFAVQVKAIRRKNFFPIRHDRIQRGHVYVFAILNQPGEAVDYFIVPGATLSDHPEQFSKWFKNPKFPGIDPTYLKPYAQTWSIFDASPEDAQDMPINPVFDALSTQGNQR